MLCDIIESERGCIYTMSIYEVLGVPEPGAEAEADKVTEAEIAEQQELNKLFGLPEMTPEAAAEQVKRQRASIEAFKTEHPGRWAEAEADAERSRGFSALRRKLDNGRAAQHEQEQG